MPSPVLLPFVAVVLVRSLFYCLRCSGLVYESFKSFALYGIAVRYDSAIAWRVLAFLVLVMLISASVGSFGYIRFVVR